MHREKGQAMRARLIEHPTTSGKLVEGPYPDELTKERQQDRQHASFMSPT
jgi:hypothetical protein